MKTAISDGSTVVPVSVDFCVSDVTAPVLSLGKMVEEGIEFFLSKSKGCWMSKDALNPEATFVGIEQVGRTFEVHEAKVKPKKDLLAPVFADEVLPGEELRAPRLLPEPRGPSDDERKTPCHMRRDCPLCVESRGVDDRHASVVQMSSENTELQAQVDYMFFTGDMDLAKLKHGQQVSVPVLVATCNEQPAEIFAVACPRKGEHAYVQETFGNNLRRLQRTKMTLQTDQEEAIVSLMSKMANELKGEIQLTMQKISGWKQPKQWSCGTSGAYYWWFDTGFAVRDAEEHRSPNQGGRPTSHMGSTSCLYERYQSSYCLSCAVWKAV